MKDNKKNTAGFFKGYQKFFAFLVLFLFPLHAHAIEQNLRYDKCTNINQSLTCAVAFEKLKSIKNPLNQKRFFDDDVHIKDGKVALLPAYYVARPDLDKDGVGEIIVALAEEDDKAVGTLCKSKYQCPHLILQDRNTEPDKPRLSYYSVIGFSYAYGIGLSTDEVINGYRSLRVYKSAKGAQFDTYQFDQKNDQYFNISGKR